MKKSFATHTCPPPILCNDFEGGAVSFQPWIRRRRRWDESSWTLYTNADRQLIYDMATKDLPPDQMPPIKPGPYVDVVWWDPLDFDGYNALVQSIGDFDATYYNTLAFDGLKDFSQETQTYSKGDGNWREPMAGMQWGGAQERLSIMLRKARNYRDKGVFIYLTAGELIDKDYVKDPRESKRGEIPQEPYSVKGTVNLPGKMTAEVQHLTDIMCHARSLNGKPAWIVKPEPLPGGSANWEAKDRTGRIKDAYCEPNVRRLLDQVYGVEIRKQIYAAGRERVVAA